MKRDPSIHITKSDLIKVLEKLAIIKDARTIVDKIFHIAKSYSIHTRTITISTDRMEKKAKKLIQSSRRDADLLAKLIYNTRQTMKHRGISLIKVGSRDWGILKEITAHALNFTNEFNLTRRYGFLKYTEIGLSKMKRFALYSALSIKAQKNEIKIVEQLQLEKPSSKKIWEMLNNIKFLPIAVN